MKIYYKRCKNGYIWGDQESKDKNVYGFAKSIPEIKRRACQMFRVDEVELVLF